MRLVVSNPCFMLELREEIRREGTPNRMGVFLRRNAAEAVARTGVNEGEHRPVDGQDARSS